jgi:hypothetical protein
MLDWLNQAIPGIRDMSVIVFRGNYAQVKIRMILNKVVVPIVVDFKTRKQFSFVFFAT